MFTFLVVVSWLIIFPSVAGVLARKKDRSVIGWVLLVLFPWQAEPAEEEPSVGHRRLDPFRKYRGEPAG